MNLISHFIVSAVLAAILYPFVGAYAFLVLVSGFLIDADHYIYYVFKYKNLNPLKANRLFTDRKLVGVFCVFHTVEVLAVVSVLALFTMSGRLLLLGLVVHHLMDFYHESKINRLDSKVR